MLSADRYISGTFAKILQLGDQVLPHDDLEVELEYEDCSITQSPLTSAKLNGNFVDLQLSEKHTDCLDKEKCGMDGEEKMKQTRAVRDAIKAKIEAWGAETCGSAL